MREATHEPTTGIAYSSLEAHQEIKPDKPKKWKLILQAMNEIKVSVTSRKLGNYSRLPFDRYEVARRLPEMEKRGMVKVVGRMPNIKNRPLLWEVTDAYKQNSFA